MYCKHINHKLFEYFLNNAKNVIAKIEIIHNCTINEYYIIYYILLKVGTSNITADLYLSKVRTILKFMIICNHIFPLLCCYITSQAFDSE